MCVVGVGLSACPASCGVELYPLRRPLMATDDSLARAIAAAEKEVAETSEKLHQAAHRMHSHIKPIPSAPPSPLLSTSGRAARKLRTLKGEPVLTPFVLKVDDIEEALASSSLRWRLCCVAVIAVAIVLLEHAVSSRSVATPTSAELSSIDESDTSWMLVSTMGVLLMIPALGLFEAGLLRAKNTVSVLMQCFVGVAVLTVVWFVIGFSLCFAPNDWWLYGSPRSFFFFSGVYWRTALDAAPTIPGILFAAFQGMFAAITPLLCTGAFAERLRFEAFLMFIVAWSLIVYYPLCHWIWGGGWLSRWGVVDFAGGIVIHTSAGVASLVTAVHLGPRAGFTGVVSNVLVPHNLPMAATGAGLLWFGWFAFNAGSALASGTLAGAHAVTHAGAS